MYDLLRDFRYGLRMLGRTPGFSLVAIFVLALGIGSTTLVFSIVDTVVFRPLPYRDPDRLLLLEFQRQGEARTDSFKLADFNALKQQPGLFENVAAFMSGGGGVLQTEEGPVWISGSLVTTNFFDLLGVLPFAGRAFLPVDAQPGASPAAVVSYGFWQNRLGGDPRALGRVLHLAEGTYSIIGILPPNFQGPHTWGPKIELWAPLETSNVFREWDYGLNVMARVAPGRSSEEVQAYLATLPARLPSLAIRSGSRVLSSTVLDDLIGGQRDDMLFLLGAVSFVLLLACANLAHLLLARVPARQSEIAVRAALGARALRLIRQLLAESVLLAVAGGSLGLLMAWWALPVVVRLAPGNTPRLDQVAIDPRVALFTLGVSLMTAVVFGLGPALALVVQPLRSMLSRTGIVGSADRRFRRFRGVMIISEFALSMVLLVGAGLLLRTFWLTRPVDLGFDPSQKIVSRAEYAWREYQSPEKQRTYYREGLEQIGRLPAVGAVAVASYLPLPDAHNLRSFADEGRAKSAERAYVTSVSPNFFQVLEIPLIAGLPFEDRDDQGSPNVAIVNETLARGVWPGEPAVGKTLQVFEQDREKSTAYRVIGVAADTRSVSRDLRVRPTIYTPFLQNPDSSVQFIVTCLAPPEQVARSVRAAMLKVEPRYPVTTRQMERAYWQDIAVVVRRFRAWLLGVLASIALLLALLGIFGSVAHGVRQRSQEIGLRLALGAESSEVVRLFLREGTKLIAFGLVVGLAGSAVLTRLIASQLVAVSPLDPLTFAAVSVLLSTAGFLAVYLPARRASRVDPMVALRHE